MTGVIKQVGYTEFSNGEQKLGSLSLRVLTTIVTNQTTHTHTHTPLEEDEDMKG